MDFALDDEQSLVVSTVRRWSERQLRAWAADADRAAAPPDALWGAAGELGLLVDAVPAEAGGMLEGGAAGYSHLSRALRGLELGRGCAALAALCESNVEPSLAVLRFGAPEAQESLFASIAAGDPTVAVTAHDAAERLEVAAAGDAIRVSGRLGPLPGLAIASHALIAARGGGEPVLLLLPLPAGAVTPISPSGWRAAAWGALELDRAEVPPALVLARGAAAAAAIAEVMSWYRVSLAARALG